MSQNRNGNDKRMFRSDDDWQNNACLNFFSDGWILYAEGYKRGADLLAEHVVEKARDQDFLIYPIVFLYRQNIELQMKMLIMRGNQLLDIQGGYPKSHSLTKLWPEVKAIVEKVWPESNRSEIAVIDALITEMNEYDPQSMSFRYPVDKQGEPSLPQELTHINIRRLSEEMEKVCGFFEGCYIGITEFLDIKHEMESYYGP